MTLKISDHLLARLSEFIAGHMGLSFPEARWHDLERGIGSAAREFGFQELETCAEWLLSSPLTRDQIEILANHLTVGETYFFREEKSLEILREQVLPELIRSREIEPRLRIWSAGCCTGEEPYSIAILLHQMLPNLQDWNISILATDINSRFLQKAAAGIYSYWSFRGVAQPVQEKYFKKTEEGRFELLPHIKKMVTFSYLNLAEDIYPSLWNHTNAMDIIFCRNVLMYFALKRAKGVIQNLYCSLVDGGWLIVSPSELSQTLFSPFVSVAFPAATFYRKESRPAHKMEVLSDSMSTETAVLPQPALFPITIPEPVQRTVGPLSDLSGTTYVSTEHPPMSNSGLTVHCTFSEEDSSSVQRTDSPLSDLSGTAYVSTEHLPMANSGLTVRCTFYQEALALYEQGCYREALEKLLAGSSEDEDDAKTMVLLARVYANQGQLREALSWCEKAIGHDRLSESAHYLQAVILQEQGALEEAENSLKRTLYLDPNFVLAHFSLGNLTLKRGKVGESLKHLENALSLLEVYRSADLIPESEGLTAGRLSEVIRSTINSHTPK